MCVYVHACASLHVYAHINPRKCIHSQEMSRSASWQWQWRYFFKAVIIQAGPIIGGREVRVRSCLIQRQVPATLRTKQVRQVKELLQF